MTALLRSFRSEWLKRQDSPAAWLVVCGACFTPAIITVAKLVRHHGLAAAAARPDFWERHWRMCWESMAIFLLPIGAILATSLVAQLEYKDNCWKLLHTTPQRYLVIFTAKLAVVLVMMAQFLALFNVGIFLSAVLPGLVWGVPFPAAPLPVVAFLADNMRYAVACLPIIALQYLLSLRCRNFLVSIGAGLALWILSIAVLNWHYGRFVPYTYCSYNFLKDSPKVTQVVAVVPWSLAYFTLFIVAAYVLYVGQEEKG